jgi:hypothetical protein
MERRIMTKPLRLNRPLDWNGNALRLRMARKLFKKLLVERSQSAKTWFACEA